MNCITCGAKNDDGAKFCSSCGVLIQLPEPTESSPTDTRIDSVPFDAPDPSPPINVTIKPRRPLFRLPLTSDWTFWLFVVLAGIGGSQAIYRTASRFYSLDNPGNALVGGVIEIALPLVFGFVVFAIIPALLRKLVLIPNDRKTWASTPPDFSAGWKADPAQVSELRWWNGSRWTNSISPTKKVGQASLWIIVGMIVVWIFAFIAGASSQQSTATKSDAIASKVSSSFEGFAMALQAYGQIQFDPENALSSLVESEAGFNNIEQSYLSLKTALSEVTSQEQLGPIAPDLGELRKLTVATEPYIESQRVYYQMYSECIRLPGGLSSPDCDIEALERAESRSVATVRPFLSAWESVIESIPSKGD